MLTLHYFIHMLGVQHILAPRCAPRFYFIDNQPINRHFRNSDDVQGVNFLADKRFVVLKPGASLASRHMPKNPHMSPTKVKGTTQPVLG